MQQETKQIRLHLGCQEKYLPGYVNIDLPPEHHTAQQVRADVFEDVRTLSYEPETIDEIRAHHLLEHFSRQETLVLLARWHKWLRPGGVLHLETPDFEAAAEKFLRGSIDDQFVLGRHIFGSHEAEWAYHKDYWSEKKFRFVLSELGFGDFRFEHFSNNLEQKTPFLKGMTVHTEPILKNLSRFGFNMLPNVVCFASKKQAYIDYENVIKRILAKSLVGRETAILDVWMKEVTGKI